MIPFLDLKSQYLSIETDLQKAVLDALASTRYALGPEVSEFEKEFATYCQTAYCVAVNSGTSALHLALLAGGIQPGDEVITTPITFVATTAAILYANAKPVFVDVRESDFTLDPTRIESAITPKTKAILPVHLYGQCANMDPILEIARKHKLIVIEDAAQAHGAEYKGRRAGSMGDMGCFSFYPGKNLGACGEGGAVTTSNAQYDRTLRMLREWGQEKKYHHVMQGFNYRMDNIQGAALRVKLRRLEAWTEGRRTHARAYRELLKNSKVSIPQELPGNRHVWHVYAVRHANRDALQTHLNNKGIQTGIHYPIPVHLCPAYSNLGYKKGDFPIAERMANEVLSIPMFPELTREQIQIVADAVQSF